MAHSGVIVAIYPDQRNLRRLVPVAEQMPNPTPADQMHVTICYLGERDALEPYKVQILAQLMLLAEAPPVPAPLELRIRGLQRMEHSDEGRNALAARVVSPDLHTLRAKVVDALKVIGVQPDQTFPVYQPHLTLGYIDNYLPTPQIRVPLLTVPAAAICLCWGDERIEIPLSRYPAELKAVSGPMATMAHGPGGLFSSPALEGGTRVRRREKADSYNPPEAARNNARRGLELRRKWGRGGTAVGVARARDLANGRDLPYQTVARMASFNRHRQHALDGRKMPDGGPSAAYIAWLLWGGTSGVDWARGITGADETSTKPFVSQAQQRWAFGTGQPFAERWADETDFSNLPRKVRRKSVSARRRELAALGFKAFSEDGSGGTAKPGGGRGYGARAGETISGNLVRGADGKFTSGSTGGGSQFGMPKLPTRKPKKPKGAGGGKGAGAKPKETPEQRAAARAAEEKANIDKVGAALMDADAPLGKNGLDALVRFAAGEKIDAETAKALADLGLVTLGADGTPRLNPDGRKVVNAAKRGEIRDAVDAAFAAGEKMGIGAAGERLPGADEPAEGDAPDNTSGVLGGAAGALRRNRGGDKEKPQGGVLSGVEGGLTRGEPGSKPAEEKPKGGGGGGGSDKEEPTDTPRANALRRAIGAAGASQGPQGAGGGRRITGGAIATPEADRARSARQQAERAAARSAERQAELEKRRSRQAEERAGRTADAVERSGLRPESFLTLRRLAEGGNLEPDDIGAVVELAGLGLVNDRLEPNSQGRRALTALERGDVRGYFAATQSARDTLEREAERAARRAEIEARRAEGATTKTLDDLLIALKHGKHDQSSHGRRGPRGRAARSSYQAARAAGASPQDARRAAADVSRAVQVRQRLANIDKQLGGAVSPRQRASLEAEARRLSGEHDRLLSRMTPDQRAAATGAEVAPTVRGRTAPAKRQPAKTDGDTTRAYGADPNTSYTMQHRLVDMADIKASNLPNGAINPDYNPALQPRDRSRAASQAQIDQVARNLNSDVLVTDFHRIDAGSPIIDRDGNVLSGNGRTLALQRAADLNPEQYAAYKQRLKDEAARLGIDPAAVDGMKNPVLVRELKGDADPVAFAREANSSGTLRMSPLEQAMVDSQQIADRSLLKLNVRDGQGIDQALRDPANKPFINDFLATVPANERANLLTRNGDLNQMGLYRAKAALYSKAFPGDAGTRLAESMLESLDPDVKTVQNGISASLPNISRATALIRSGDRDRDLDLTEDFARTIDVYARIKDNPALTANTPANQLVSKYLNQGQMFERELTPDQEKLLVYVDSISRKPTAVAAMFNRWASIVEDQPPPGQASLFGGGRMTKSDLIDALVGSGGATNRQAGLFDGF